MKFMTSRVLVKEPATPAKPAAKQDKEAPKDEDEAPARLEYAGKNDYQFQQALNILKGAQIMQGK